MRESSRVKVESKSCGPVFLEDVVDMDTMVAMPCLIWLLGGQSVVSPAPMSRRRAERRRRFLPPFLWDLGVNTGVIQDMSLRKSLSANDQRENIMTV